MIKKYLSRFDFVGVREQSGVDLCHRLGISKAVRVVDPTLLLTCDDYARIQIKTKKAKRYLFLYLLGSPITCRISTIYRFARKKGLEVVYVASQGQSDRRKKTYPQIGEWIDYIANAEIVVTNSFHGTVFSLIYQKKFVTLPLTKGYERMNVRIEELLQVCKLDFAIYNGNLSKIYNREFDFSTFLDYQKIEKNKSDKYLATVFSSV